MSESPQGRFPTTNWSLIWNAGDEFAEDRRIAVDRLLTTYWPVLVKYLIQRKRIEHHDAEDLVQGFITNKVLERNLVGCADRDRGRFRNLLVKSLDNYVLHEFEKRNAKKRRAEHALAVDPKDVEVWKQEQRTAGDTFDIEWAKQLLQMVAERMHAECNNSNREHIWGVFETRILLPATEGREPIEYDELVSRFGFESPSQASNALVTAKRMYARTLKATVAEYALDAADTEAEIRELEVVLARR